MWMQLAQAGMSAANAYQQYQVSKDLYKAQKSWQDYNNKMTRLVDAQNQNAITTNTLIRQEASTMQAINNQRSTILTTGTAKVAAGAAGVEGASVNATMFDIQRNGAVAEYTRSLDLEHSLDQFDQQRLQSAMSSEMQQDYSYIPKPDLMTDLMGSLAGSLDKYNRKPNTGGGDASSVLGF